jgi:hypothetical protein
MHGTVKVAPNEYVHPSAFNHVRVIREPEPTWLMAAAVVGTGVLLWEVLFAVGMTIVDVWRG